ARERWLLRDALLKIAVLRQRLFHRVDEFLRRRVAADDPRDHVVRRENEKCRKRRHRIALREFRSVSAVFGVEAKEDHLVGRGLKRRRREDFLLHLVAPAAPVGKEVDEDELLGLSRFFLRRRER